MAFIVANLNRGGVADHVKILAKSLIDRGIDAPTLERCNHFADVTRATLKQTRADWIGLHFVSYGWSHNGILRAREIKELKAACSGHNLVLYLHELWIGESCHEPLMNRLIGALQRRGILRLIAALQPNRIVTSNPTYHTILHHWGVTAQILPLPGNLPAPTVSEYQAASDWLAKHEIAKTKLAAVFGTIHPEWDATSALASWQSHLAAHHQSGALLTLGQHGAHGDKILADLKTKLPDLRIVNTGPQPASLIAGLIAQCSYGIATSPWALIGKSGTAAAFLDAGLPTLITRDDWQWRRGPTPKPNNHPLLRKWSHPDLFDWDSFLSSRREAQSTLENTASYWAELVQSAPNDSPACAS